VPKVAVIVGKGEGRGNVSKPKIYLFKPLSVANINRYSSYSQTSKTRKPPEIFCGLSFPYYYENNSRRSRFLMQPCCKYGAIFSKRNNVAFFSS
jgi:hypothetical protein